MFSTPTPEFRGIQPIAPWLADFQHALSVLDPFDPAALEQMLEKSLEHWARGSSALVADATYTPVERYCIRQRYLWRIYAAYEAHGKGSEIGRSIYNRAVAVIDETPEEARPLDLSFREGENLIRKTMAHLLIVSAFYEKAILAKGAPPAEPFLPPSPGFKKTTALEATTDPAEARNQLLTFMTDNQYVRAIVLGNDADITAGATVVDNRLNIPGAGITPGRGLWVKDHILLRPEISTWLGATLPHEYEQLSCIFISPKGKASSFLTKADPLDQANVSAGLLDAADADEPV